MTAHKLTADRLRDVLEYIPPTGNFKWLKRLSIRIVAGDKAGCVNKDGYLTIRIDGEIEYAHRLAWMYVYGSLPTGQIDHINGNRLDNRIENLRIATQAINSQNQRRARADSKIGLLGVSRKRNKWHAQIVVDGNHKSLGTFDTPSEAHSAYIDAKRKLHAGCTI